MSISSKLCLLFLITIFPHCSPLRLITPPIPSTDPDPDHHHHRSTGAAIGWSGGIEIDFPYPGGDTSSEGGFQFEFSLPGFGSVVVSGGGSVSGGLAVPFPTFPLPLIPVPSGDPFHCAPLSCIRGDALGCQRSYGVTQSNFMQTPQHVSQFAAAEPAIAVMAATP